MPVKKTGRKENLTNAGKGRPKGVLNKVTREIKDICSRLVHDETYQVEFAARLHEGKLAPAIECMVWHYAFGKPKETVDIQGEIKVPPVVQFVLMRTPGAECRD